MTEQSPREIVARVHERIAALSPEHASLVAAYEAIPRSAQRPVRRPRPHPAYQSRQRRLTVYSQLRLAGREPRAAARSAGVGPSSSAQYEADFLASLGGAW